MMDMSSEDYFFLFEQQKAAFQSARLEPISKRLIRLKELEQWILDHISEIQSALQVDLGKSKDESSVSEIIPLLAEIRHAKRHLKRWAKSKSVASTLTTLGSAAKTVCQPKGVCLIISPWNYPWLLSLGPVVSAIAAGNVITLKPSEFSSQTSLLLSKMIEELFDRSYCAVCLGDERVSKQLLDLPYNHVFFTGSPKVGKVVMEAASKHLSSVTLELGGKSPTIVDETADIATAAKRIAWGKWLNAGQTCLAPDYLFVQEKIQARLLELLSAEIQALYGNLNGMTKIINATHFTRLQDLMNNAKAAGQEIYLEGQTDLEELKMNPTIVLSTDGNTRLMNDEIFGPILPIVSFQKLEWVVDTINSKPAPLAIYVFTKNRKTREKLIAETSSGGVVFNDCVLQFAHPNLPFGGVNNSGIGRSHGEAGFIAFSNERSIMTQRFRRSLSQLVYPPYDKLKKALINVLIKYL